MSTPPSALPRPWRTEMGPLVRLAIPIVAVQLGMRAMNTVDMVMLGHMPAEIGNPEAAMAAAALGNAWSWLPTIFAIGVLMACDPLFSQAVGAKDEDAISRTFHRGIVWALLMTAPVVAVVWRADLAMEWTEQPEHLIGGATLYARVLALGHLPVLIYGVLRQALQAQSIVRPLLWTILGANLFNAAANWVLIRGHLGFPALGLEGSAYATVASRWLMTLLLVALAWPCLGRHIRSLGDRPLRQRALRAGPMLRMFWLGLPIGIGLTLELGIFAATTLSVGSFGASAIAGHQAALDLASTTFMIPMGLGAAVAVRVGHAIGEGDTPKARAITGCSLLLGSGIMGVFALWFLATPTLFGGLYLDATEAAAALAVTAVLIPVAGVFQVFDGLQAVASGVLRGLGETRIPMLVNIIGFWGLGFPIGLWLAQQQGLGAAGLWWGLVIGLGLVALGLLWLVRRRLSREQSRLSVD